MDTSFIIELATLALGGGGIAVFFDRKQKKQALELENAKAQIENEKSKLENERARLESSQSQESYTIQNIKERYDSLEAIHNELVNRHKAVIQDKMTLLDETTELKKTIALKDIEIQKLKEKVKSLNSKLKTK